MDTVYALFICSYLNGQTICSDTMRDEKFKTLAECEQMKAQIAPNLAPSPYVTSQFVCMKKSVPAWEPAE